MTNIKAAVFASGAGSNFAALADADLPCEIALLVSDKPEAAVVEKAEKRGIPVFIFQPKAHDGKAAYEAAIIEELEKRDVEWIFLAGYMRIVGETLLHKYENRIINIHPSLLPAFPGKDAIGQAFTAGVKETGVTVHYIDAGVDTGPVIAQEKVALSEQDTRESLQRKIQVVEHHLYPKVIQQLLK